MDFPNTKLTRDDFEKIDIADVINEYTVLSGYGSTELTTDELLSLIERLKELI
jgi:hypothetical protein